MKANYEPGYMFGNLEFINEDFHEKEVTGYQKYRKAVILCFCGRKFITRISGLLNNTTKSCGCIQKDIVRKRLMRHNMSDTSEYKTWEGMKRRCLNPDYKFYKNYGGRGITICEEWLDFRNFIKDMGKKPFKEYSLDRINNDLGYFKENCRWTTREQQDRNKSTNIYLEYNDKTYIVSDLAKEFGLEPNTLKDRLNKGMSLEQALNKKYNYNKK
jgi:hypothetical protein